jgi:ribosomal protein L16/L10AE
MLQYPLGSSLTVDSQSPNNRDSKTQALQRVKNTGVPGEDRSMKQFKVTFTRILTHEEVIEAASLEAARK